MPLILYSFDDFSQDYFGVFGEETTQVKCHSYYIISRAHTISMAHDC